MKIVLTILLASIILFSFTANISAQENVIEQQKPQGIIIDTSVQINLVMVGDTWSQEDQKGILDKLAKSYVPNIFYEKRSAGVNYTYNYVFTNMTAEKSDELFAYMDTVAVKNTLPEFIAEWMRSSHPEFGKPERQTYKMISAYAVEDWLAKLERVEGYTIYFLNPSKEKVSYFHTYGTTAEDPDTGKEFIQEGMMGFGGKYRFYFIDLTAGPWLYPYVPTSDGHFLGQFHKNIHDINTNNEYHKFIADYANNANMLLFTPSYLYSPVYKLNHKINVFLIDMTAGRVFRDVSGKFINKSVIENAFAKLVPYAKWSSDIQGSSFDSLPRELQRAILKSVTFKEIAGHGSIALVRSSDLIIELNKWVTSNLPKEQQAKAEEEAEKTVSIPAVLFIFDAEAYVDREAVIGTAVPDPADETVPCCAIVAIDKHALFDIGTGLSTVTIHEMGHVLGLRHPHDGYGSDGEFGNWFFDWSYTPMTYSAPSALGCGLEQGCGLVITEFGQFNYDTFDRGIVLYLLNQTLTNIRDSMLKIEAKGYGKAIPASISSTLSNAEDDITVAKEYFANMSYFNHTTFKGIANIMDPMDDAFDFALRAALASEEVLQASDNLANRTGPIGIQTVDVSQPMIVDESGNKLGNIEVGRSISIRSQISNNVKETVVFTYIVQVKDNNGATVFLTWLDGLSASDKESVEPSILWIPDTDGEFKVEVFVWQSMKDPVPLSQVRSVTINASS